MLQSGVLPLKAGERAGKIREGFIEVAEKRRHCHWPWDWRKVRERAEREPGRRDAPSKERPLVGGGPLAAGGNECIIGLVSKGLECQGKVFASPSSSPVTALSLCQPSHRTVQA